MRVFAFLWLMAGAASATEIDASRFAQFVAERDAEIVILGEVHDNPAHHANQAAAIAAIEPRALVWEMLTEEQARQMPLVRTDPMYVAAALGWKGSGWPSFDLYFPLIEAAGEAQHFGAGVPRPEARRAFAEGAAAVFGPGAGRFGLEDALPPDEQARREAEQFAAHCEAMPRDIMSGMVEAQRLRDASLARAALDALRETGGPVVVVTGSGHARGDVGVPALLELVAPEVDVLSVGQLEGQPEADAPWDVWIVTEPHPRPDPCLSFR